MIQIYSAVDINRRWRTLATPTQHRMVGSYVGQLAKRRVLHPIQSGEPAKLARLQAVNYETGTGHWQICIQLLCTTKADGVRRQ